MKDDFKSEEEKTKEIDDFLSQFNKPDEVEDSFDEITDRFGKSFGGTGEEYGGPSPPKPSPKSEENLSGGRMQRLRSQQDSGEGRPSAGQKISYALLCLLAAIRGFFRRIAVSLKLIAPASEANAEEISSGETMSRSEKKKKKKRYRINIKRLILFFIILFLLAGIAAGAVLISIIRTTPPIDTADIYSLLSENSVLYDSQGQVLENITKPGTSEIRTNIAYSDLPTHLVNAFIAIEDKTFWKHHGFNFIRIGGAIWESVTKGEPISGTSTITQQLARNLYLSADREMVRKIQEAWYALQLEKEMTKEQIIEAYLNTINLGYGSFGVQAAAQAYFSKDVSELTLPECAALATIPKSPGKYALLKGDSNENIDDPDSLDIVSRTDDWTIWYNDAFVERQHLVLRFMLEQELISQQEYDEAMAYDVRQSINPGSTHTISQHISSYFADYTIRQVVSDLMKEYGKTEEEAREMLYTKGLRIYSTIDVSMQSMAEEEFAKPANFPRLNRRSLKKDGSGNILSANGQVLLYNKANYFDGNGNFILSASEYQWNPDGSLTIFAGKRMNFYNTKVQNKTDVSVEFKNLYTEENDLFYNIGGGVIAIGADYKSKDSDGNLVIRSQFFTDHPKVFVNNGNSLSVGPDYYSLKQMVLQPQSAMVIMDYHTGQIKAMVGGRSTTGRLLYNRATGTRQPGSSFKPIGVYGPALQSGADGQSDWTAASVIDDAPMIVNGRQWPKNWYSGFRGLHTLRTSVEQSVNVNAVKVFTDIGVDASLKFAKGMGITSIVEEGSINDLNAAALALGGMTNGVSPLEMAAAYGTFANGGTYTEPICYTKITDKNGTILLEKTPHTHQAMDPGVASIMTDILRTTVTNGLAKRAAISGQPTAGKTGTTTDNYDAWFVGFTPYYSAAVWIGNDVNLELSEGSAAATKVWQLIMNQVHQGYSRGSFKMAENVVSAAIDTKSGKLPSELSEHDPRGSTVKTEYFVRGTVPIEIDDVHVKVTVCSDSNYLATPWCPDSVEKVAINRPGGPTSNLADSMYDAPIHYCNLHNIDTTTYPPNPGVEVNRDFVPAPQPDDPNNPDNPNGSDGNNNSGEGVLPPDGLFPPDNSSGSGSSGGSGESSGGTSGDNSGGTGSGESSGGVVDSGPSGGNSGDSSSDMPEWLQ